LSKIAILGGGSWGTGLSVVLGHSRRKHEISIWVREASIAQGISDDRENKTYLPGIPVPPCLQAFTDIGEVLRDAQIVVGAVPSAHAREVYTRALPHVSPDTIIVSATKGLEPATHLRMSEVIEQVFSLRFVPQVAVLSGPSFAIEAARGVIDYALGPLRLTEVFAEVDEGNTASAAVLDRVGMLPFGEVAGALGAVVRYRTARRPSVR